MKTTLRTKILIVLVIIFSLMGGMTYIIHNQVLTPSYLKLERQHIADNTHRVIQALINEQQHLSTLVNDWSAWDDTYEFIVDENTDYVKSNLTDSTFSINKTNLIVFIDSSGKPVWQKAYDNDFETVITIEPFDKDLYTPDFPLLKYSKGALPLADQQATGLLITSAGPMLCAARPVLDSNDNGPSHGTLIMGRFLNQEMIEHISDLTNIDYSIAVIDGDRVDNEEAPAAGQLRYKSDGNILTATTVFFDLSRKAAIEISVIEERSILQQGLKTMRLSLTLTFVGIAIALAIMMLMLQRSVVTPINKLTRGLLESRKNDKPLGQVELKRCVTSEIILLMEEFNQLVEGLDNKRNQLADTNFTLMTEAKKLKEAQHNLRNLDKLKSEFISTAAHELRTPLASIMGFTELLSGSVSMTNFDEDQKQGFMTEIYTNCERLTKIVDDILDISRIEAGMSIPLDKELIIIKDLLNKSTNNFNVRVKHKLVLAINPEAPKKLLVDAHRISQVLENLLSNAIKYSPADSEILLKVEVEGRYCRFSVTDQGIGMTEEQVARVFDKFYRADASNTAVRGLGLGMSIVKQIVEDHGGTIWVESTQGEGTKVYFTLPLTDS